MLLYKLHVFCSEEVNYVIIRPIDDEIGLEKMKNQAVAACFVFCCFCSHLEHRAKYFKSLALGHSEEICF
jgi:hypothetical protein